MESIVGVQTQKLIAIIMARLTRCILTVLVLLGTQSILALKCGSKSSMQSEGRFRRSLMGALNPNSAFSGDQMKSVSSIGNTYKTAIGNMGDEETRSKLLATIKNIVSAVPGMAVEIVDDVRQSVAENADAIVNAVTLAFGRTTGIIESQYINEITQLVG